MIIFYDTFLCLIPTTGFSLSSLGPEYIHTVSESPDRQLMRGVPGVVEFFDTSPFNRGSRFLAFQKNDGDGASPYGELNAYHEEIVGDTLGQVSTATTAYVFGVPKNAVTLKKAVEAYRFDEEKVLRLFRQAGAVCGRALAVSDVEVSSPVHLAVALDPTSPHAILLPGAHARVNRTGTFDGVKSQIVASFGREASVVLDGVLPPRTLSEVMPYYRHGLEDPFRLGETKSA